MSDSDLPFRVIVSDLVPEDVVVLVDPPAISALSGVPLAQVEGIADPRKRILCPDDETAEQIRRVVRSRAIRRIGRILLREAR